MQDSAGAQIHDNKYIQRSERGRDYNEEVARCNHLRMVADESRATAALDRRCEPVHRRAGFPYGARRYTNAELQLQFFGDAFLTPCHILGGHLSVQLAQVLWKAVFPSVWISIAKAGGTRSGAT